MIFRMAGNFVVFLLSTFILFIRADLQRQVHTVSLQPSTAPTNSTAPNMFHTRAVGPHDILHYLTSSYGFPGVLVAKTDSSATLTIDWERLLSDNVTDTARSISFSTPPQYVYGLQFLQLIEYEDTEDKANLSAANTNTTHGYSLSTAPWANSSAASHLEDNTITLQVNQNYTDTHTDESVVFMSGGSLALKIQINNETIRAADLPHLQETSNTSHIDVILDHIMPKYTKTRYAVEMLYVTPVAHNKSVKLNTQTSIDDEHTPGTFQIIDVSPSTTPSSFIQWKPVCYKSPDRAMKYATKVAHYAINDGVDVISRLDGSASMLYAYYGDEMYDSRDYEIVGMNVSFGLPQDKFYSHTHYTAWSLSLGYGTAPPEEISLMIIIIISIGLGLPVLIIMFGSLGACIHKKKRENPDNSGSYTAIN